VSVGLYMDVHVALAITEQLRMRDVDVLTSQTDNATRLDDSPLLDRATELLRHSREVTHLCSPTMNHSGERYDK
jgi:hypothetical protein